MSDLLAACRDLPLPVRWALVTGAVVGAVGAVTGLVVGLAAHPATAWFAVAELGAPAAMAGAVLGALAGVVASRRRAVR